MKLRCSKSVLFALATLAPATKVWAQDIQISPAFERIDSYIPLPNDTGAVYRIVQPFDSFLFRSRLRLPNTPQDLHDAQLGFFPGAYSVTADSRRLVYITSAAFEYVVSELYSQPLDGSALPVKLNGPLAAQEDVTAFVTSPDSRHTVFFVEESGSGNRRFFTAPLDGSAPAVEFSGPVPDSNSFRISPDGQHVFYEAVNGSLQLWSAPIDASAPPQALPGRSLYSTLFQFVGSRVLYCTSVNANPSLFVELYSAPVDGSSAPVRINAPLVSGGNVQREFSVTPDGTRVVYGADQEVNGRLEIYVAPIDGSAAPLKLSGPIGSDLPRPDAPWLGFTPSWELATNGSRVFYRGFRPTQRDVGLFLSVPLDASTAPVQLLSYQRTHPTAIRLAGDSRVLYYDPTAIYSMPDDGSAPAVRLTPSFVTGGSMSSFVLDPSGERLLYLADQEQDELRELYWTTVDGRNPVRKVSSGAQVGYSYGFTRDGNRVLYTSEVHQSGVSELFLDFLTPMYLPR